MPGKTIRTLSEQLPCFIAKRFPVIRPPTLSAAQAVAYFILPLASWQSPAGGLSRMDTQCGSWHWWQLATLTEEEVRAPMVGQKGEGWPRGTQEGCEWS